MYAMALAMVKCNRIERGFFQSEIRKNAYRLKKEADSEGRILVGVNKFIDSNEEQQKLLRVGEEVGTSTGKSHEQTAQIS